MNNAISNEQNKRFSKVQEELKRLLSIIMCSVEEQAEGFDSIISTSNNPEDIKIAEELNKSIKELDKSAQEYVQNIGIPSKTQISYKNKENISTTKVVHINPIVSNVKSKKSDTTLIKSKDDFDIEH